MKYFKKCGYRKIVHLLTDNHLQLLPIFVIDFCDREHKIVNQGSDKLQSSNQGSDKLRSSEDLISCQ